MRARSVVVALGVLASVTQSARAQGSVFALRGLGWNGRGVSARSAGAAGSVGMFDASMSLNPASLARWRSVAAWGVAAPTQRSFDGPTGSATLSTVRFPLFGVAAPLPPRIVLGFSISDFLDRTWTVTRKDSTVLRGQVEPFTDAGRSVGGVSDMQFGAAYRFSRVHVGLGLHYYLGATRLTAQRVFDNILYDQILEQSETDFTGVGVGAGMVAGVGKLDLAASGRLNGSLRSRNTTGTEARTPLPAMLALGVRMQTVPGVFMAASAQYEGWARADAALSAGGGEHARNTWALSGGVEVLNATVIKLHTPLRLGYRWRQLPFTSLGEPLNEWGIAGGIALNFSADRTTVDISVEHGSREAGPAREKFNTLFVGLTVRP